MVLPGFNTDFKYKGLVYHAQTEDVGEHNPVVVSHLYLKGAILVSKRISYGHLLEGGDYRGKLIELMKAQHRHIMKQVLTGGFDSTVREEAADAAQEATAGRGNPTVPGSLDEAIMEFLDTFAAGAAGGVTGRE